MRQSDTKEPDRQNAQLILLSGFMIMLGTLTFLVLLNNLILTANLPTSGLDLSKQDVQEFRTLAISEIEYAAQITLQYGIDNSANETLMREYFFNYTDVMGENLSQVFAARGTSVEVKVNNVSFNSTLTHGERTITVQKFITQGHFFPNESLIIPMDGHQNNTLQAYRFVWNIVNNTSVPVYAVLQDPVNSSNINFYLNVTSYDIAVPSMGPGTIQNRSYSGGPFMIDATNLENSTLQWIYNESLNFTPNITIHGLSMGGGINMDYTVAINEVPSVAVYQDTETIDKYYSDMRIPYTPLDNSDILAGSLTIDNYSILLTHANMSPVNSEVVLAIVNWTADGGVLYAEYLGSATMDIAVEAVDNNTAHTWFGFIGINESNNSNMPTSQIPNGPYVKLINSSFNLPMPLSVFVNYGAPFNQLSQTNNTSGMYGPVENHSSGRGVAFTLNNTTDAVNPGTNIIGYLAYPNGSQIIYDDDEDGELEYHLAYVEAPFENGRVIYMAGHNISTRGIQAERIAGEIFYASVFRDLIIIDTHNINVTLTYNDGMATFEDTVLLEI